MFVSLAVKLSKNGGKTVKRPAGKSSISLYLFLKQFFCSLIIYLVLSILRSKYEEKTNSTNNASYSMCSCTFVMDIAVPNNIIAYYSDKITFWTKPWGSWHILPAHFSIVTFWICFLLAPSRLWWISCYSTYHLDPWPSNVTNTLVLSWNLNSAMSQ